MPTLAYTLADIKRELNPPEFYGYSNVTITLEGTTAAGSASVTGLQTTANLTAGMSVTSPALVSGAVLDSIDTATAVTLSVPATETRATVSMTFTDTAGDTAFDTALGTVLDTIAIETMPEYVGSTTWAAIYAKAYTAMSTTERLVYRAAIYFTAAEFLEFSARKEGQARKAETETVTDSGRTVTLSGRSGKQTTAALFRGKARRALTLAGYVTNHMLTKWGTVVSPAYEDVWRDL